MGDISEMRGLIVVGSFLALTFFLITYMPADFYYVSGETNPLPDVPEEFSALDYVFFNNSWGHYLNDTNTYYYAIDPSHLYLPVKESYPDGEGVGGWTLTAYYNFEVTGTHVFKFLHVHSEWWGLAPADHWMSFTFNGQSRGTELTGPIMDADMNTGATNAIKSALYTVKCNHLTVTLSFAFNSTTYPLGIEYAWNAGDVACMMNMNMDQTNTDWNGFSLIIQFLTISMPNIHWVVNAILVVPIYLCVGYLTFIFILRAIGAVFGGGGA